MDNITNCLASYIKSFYEQYTTDLYYTRLIQDYQETDEAAYLAFKTSLSGVQECFTTSLYKLFAKQLQKWIFEDKTPTRDVKLEYANIVQEEFPHSVTLKIEILRESVSLFCDCNTQCCSLDNCCCFAEQTYLQDLLKSFSKFDIQKILGVDRTVGTVESLPPPLEVLWNSFCLPHPKSSLIIGARQLSKHCVRCKWWGDYTGSEANKNEHSVKIFARILNSMVWLNMHMLPDDQPMLEIRCDEGYGMRWSVDGEFFRGFLEPPMLNGHQKGWKH